MRRPPGSGGREVSSFFVYLILRATFNSAIASSTSAAALGWPAVAICGCSFASAFIAFVSWASEMAWASFVGGALTAGFTVVVVVPGCGGLW